MDFGSTEEEVEFKLKDMEEEFNRVKSREEEFRRLKDQEKKTVIAVGKKDKVEQVITKDQVSLGSKESDIDQYSTWTSADLDKKTLIKIRQNSPQKEKKCWSRKRFEAMPGLGIGFSLVTVLLYQCMNIITKKMTTHPFVILFLRDCLLLPQVKKDHLSGVNVLSSFSVFPSAYLWQGNTFSKRQDVAFSPEVRMDRSDEKGRI